VLYLSNRYYLDHKTHLVIPNRSVAKWRDLQCPRGYGAPSVGVTENWGLEAVAGLEFAAVDGGFFFARAGTDIAGGPAQEEVWS
jgi:hypothetical protein